MPKHAVLTEYTLPAPTLRHDMTIGLVADIHERNAEEIAALLEQSRPDIIAVAGDTLERIDADRMLKRYKNTPNLLRRAFFTGAAHINYFMLHRLRKTNRPDTQNAYAFLARAAKIAPVYFSLGNHEDRLFDEDTAFLRRHGITVLNNSAVTVMVNHNRLLIGGISEENEETEAWLARFAQRDGFKLLLCHRPEHFDTMVADKDIDLTLAGHNHGGQIRVFGRGLVSSGGKLFPRYDRGVFDNRLVVSAGCANTVALPRLGNPRELVVVRLSAQKSNA